MHTFEAKGCVFNYNSDLSGEVRIHNQVSGEIISVPAEALVEFVAECFVRPRLIAAIERAEPVDLLLGLGVALTPQPPPATG